MSSKNSAITMEEEETCENCYYHLYKDYCPVPQESQGQLSSTGTFYCPFWTDKDGIAHTLKDQKEKDNAKLKEEVTDAYERGYDKGHSAGYKEGGDDLGNKVTSAYYEGYSKGYSEGYTDGGGS